MDAGGTGLLGQTNDRLADIFAGIDQVSVFVDDDDDEWELLALLLRGDVRVELADIGNVALLKKGITSFHLVAKLLHRDLRVGRLFDDRA